MPKLPEKLYSAEQVRELDRIAIQEHDIPGLELMLRAAQTSFKNIRMNWREIEAIAVFCGSGNNGGDGYALAKIFMEEDFSVIVYAVAPPEKLKGDALTAYLAYKIIGGKIQDYHPDTEYVADFFVDAVLGTGINRKISGRYFDAIETINSAKQPVIALDIPSGLNADTGVKMGHTVCADATICFIGLKQGLFTGDAANYCGKIYFSDLDVPGQIYQQVPTAVALVQPPVICERERCAHKGKYGHVLIIGGDKGYSGAARLAAEAASRLGAGLVSVATHIEHAGIMDLILPEIMCHGVENQQQLQPLLEKASMIVIGPGFGQSEWAQELLLAAIVTDKPLLVDADGLNLLAKQPQQRNNWVLTPHPGEAARLLGCTTANINRDRFAAVLAIQKKYGGQCVLKGAGTLISDGQSIVVSTTGNPGMASGGMGDVLAGVIAGLMAQGMESNLAASTGVYIHGQAADIAAEEQGERGMLASDLMVYLQRLVNPK
jgi:NAD(P)H-hydrate epimerase